MRPAMTIARRKPSWAKTLTNSSAESQIRTRNSVRRVAAGAILMKLLELAPRLRRNRFSIISPHQVSTLSALGSPEHASIRRHLTRRRHGPTRRALPQPTRSCWKAGAWDRMVPTVDAIIRPVINKRKPRRRPPCNNSSQLWSSLAKSSHCTRTRILFLISTQVQKEHVVRSLSW